MDLSYPQVMGILNVTPDSFYAGSRKQTETEIAERTLQIVSEGGSIIDVGAYSSRSNAEHISAEEGNVPVCVTDWRLYSANVPMPLFR